MTEEQLDALHHRQDVMRHMDIPLYLKPVGEQIRFYMDRIAFEMGELQQPAWKIGPDPERYTALCRVRIHNYQIEIAALRREEAESER